MLVKNLKTGEIGLYILGSLDLEKKTLKMMLKSEAKEVSINDIKLDLQV